MRSRTRQHLLTREDGLDDSPSMRVWIDNGGVSAAAWLAWQHRRPLRARGKIDFVIDGGVETPPWFRVAIQVLRRRRKWSVIVWTASGRRHYRLHWNGGKERARA